MDIYTYGTNTNITPESCSSVKIQLHIIQRETTMIVLWFLLLLFETIQVLIPERNDGKNLAVKA